METLVARQAALRVTLREISLLNSGMCLDMIDTKNAGLFFIPKLMASLGTLSFYKHFILLVTSMHVKYKQEKRP